MSALLWIVIFAVAILIFNKTAREAVASLGSKAKSGVPDGAGLKSLSKLKPLLFAAAALGVFLLFFTDIPVQIFDHDWGTTPIGERLESEYGEGTSWWLWVIAPLAAILVYKYLKGQKFNATAHHVPFADNFSILVVGIFLLGLLGLFTAWTTDVDDAILGTLEQPTFGSVTCAQERLEELQYTRNANALRTVQDVVAGTSTELKRIPNFQPGIRLNVCPGDGRIEWLFTEPPQVANGPRGMLEVTYTSRFREENPDIVNNFPPRAFLMPQQGAIPDAWYLYVPQSNRSTGFVSPFELGVDFVEVNIRTVYPNE